jgi:hypothetical protein
MAEFVPTTVVISQSGPPGTAPTGPAPGAAVAKAIDTTPAHARPIEAQVEPMHSGPRSLSEVPASTKALLAKLRKTPEQRAAAEKPVAAPPAVDEDDPAGDDPDDPAADEDDPDDPAEPAKPAAPDFDARVLKARGSLDARAAEVDRKLEEYRKTAEPRLKRLADAEEKLADDPLAAIRDFVAAALGIDDPAAATAETDRIFEEWTGQKLGVTGESKSTASRETARLRKVEKDLAKWKQEQRTAEESQKVVEAEREYAETIESTVQSLGSQVSEADYPFLHALGDKPAGQIVWEVISAHHEKATRGLKPEEADKVPSLSLPEAAKLANDYYRKQAESRYGKIRHLLEPDRTPEGAKQRAAESGTAKQDAPVSKRPRTLTNATASVTPARTAEEKPVFDDPRDEQLYYLRKHKK